MRNICKTTSYSVNVGARVCVSNTWQTVLEEHTKNLLTNQPAVSQLMEQSTRQKQFF